MGRHRDDGTICHLMRWTDLPPWTTSYEALS